ncbi:Cys-tRNA(Pro)/Cys-tRNA(Cys) deacylase [Microvirga lupini]|uniref:Cys-tRNA(Pro)/Cys-tRNA(Cys) deacylase n=1 Tax=Microvirga lupini TaxID=420324 RepID=A0A7W4VJY6_9HYPH|nr:Cys-tRNA(Pro) deacylase [Microvirga lupini]MBB3018550.1 Cys-tRNA(Pro)/Cys-tRNA(Cys) deacylase [Microvirga lupini]
MSKTTRATLALQQAGVSFTVHSYDYDPNADRIGLQAAQAMGADPSIVLKTLMVLVDNKPACVILPSDQEVNLKKLAAILGGKAAQMMKPADAERITGYHVGGISPFGQKKRVPTVLEQSASEHAEVFINGGRRGLQVKLDPRAAAEVLGAKVAGVI